MNLTEWTPFSSIRYTTGQVVKHTRKSLILLGLASRVFSQWTQRYLDKNIGFTELYSNISSSITSKVPLIEQMILQWDVLWMDTLTLIYGDAWAMIQPHLPLMGTMWILWIIFSIIIYMVVAHLTIDSIEWNTTTWGQRTTKIIKQFIPYLITVSMQGFATLLLFSLFIIPWIIVWVYWMFTNIISLHKDIWYWNAMKESRATVKWRRRKTSWVIFSLVLSAMIWIILVSSVSSFLIGWITDSVTEMWIITMIAAILGVIIQVLIVTFYLRWEKTKIITS